PPGPERHPASLSPEASTGRPEFDPLPCPAWVLRRRSRLPEAPTAEAPAQCPRPFVPLLRWPRARCPWAYLLPGWDGSPQYAAGCYRSTPSPTSARAASLVPQQ